MSKPTIPTTVLAVTVAALTTPALIPTAAQAAECKKEANGKFVLCLKEPLLLTEGTFHLHTTTDTGTNYIFKSAGITTECPEVLLSTGATITGTSTAVTFAHIVLHFIKCKTSNPAHCAILNELIITSTLAGNMQSKEVALFYPEKGTHFATISYVSSGGTCLVASNLNLHTAGGAEKEGPLCNRPNIEKTTILHLIECTGAEGTNHLKLGEEEATFKGNFSDLLQNAAEEPEKWAIIEGK